MIAMQKNSEIISEQQSSGYSQMSRQPWVATALRELCPGTEISWKISAKSSDTILLPFFPICGIMILLTLKNTGMITTGPLTSASKIIITGGLETGAWNME